MDEAADIEQLIADGLDLYGQGDLDGALLLWEQVLATDPENPQASSYVDYVRDNYELLTAEVNGEVDAAPFGIGSDEDEYSIEIFTGEVGVSSEPSAPTFMDPADEGWMFEEERNAVSFDDATREFAPQATVEAQHVDIRPPEPPPAAPIEPADDEDSGRNEFEDPHSTEGFGAPQDTATPHAFTNQETALRKRDQGFVTASVPAVRDRRTSAIPPELKMTLRTPGDPIEPPAEPEPITLEPVEPKVTFKAPTNELVASLPTPTRSHSLSGITIPGVGAPTHVPAPPTESPAVSASSTQDFDQKTLERTRAPRPESEPGRDVPTNKIQALPKSADLLISAPTRDLGLRPQKALIEDEETKPVGRKATVADVVLPFDPVAARSAQLLVDLDDGAPPNEPRDERTKRRINGLFERAQDATKRGELDRAVTAIDLALSEDPNSALAQKLIQRNRETVQSVFQAFLGNLDRQPQLARPLQELAKTPISPRAAFLLSRVDGSLTLDEILDVSGMPRLEAFRHLCQLYLVGILR